MKSESVDSVSSIIRHKLLRITLYLLFLLILTECGARSYWALRGSSFFNCHRSLHRIFYPELADIETHTSSGDNESFDILILGGSVLTQQWSSVEPLLREQLATAAKRPVTIYNLAAEAHTTRDSLIKYRHLDGQHFDLILLYHGINEVRANNCPPDMFRSDYDHYSWYRLINTFEQHQATRRLIFPYTFYYIWTAASQQIGWSSDLPTGSPPPEWLHFAADIKTLDSFRENVTHIVSLANQRNQLLLLMTFGCYDPTDIAGRVPPAVLEETFHNLTRTRWGEPEHVYRAVNAHNKVIKDIASRSSGTLFIDQDKHLQKRWRHFKDICHFEQKASEQFVALVVENVLPHM
jgi:hypothetical protein